jgi:hypothetical protein
VLDESFPGAPVKGAVFYLGQLVAHMNEICLFSCMWCSIFFKISISVPKMVVFECTDGVKAMKSIASANSHQVTPKNTLKQRS